MNGEVVDPVDSKVFLGTTIDSKLQRGRHIDELTNRLNSAAFAIKKIRLVTDVETARLLYFSYYHKFYVLQHSTLEKRAIRAKKLIY